MLDQFLSSPESSESALGAAWKQALFVLDSSIILQVFEFNDTSRNELIEILKRIGDQIWIPHHVAFEFDMHMQTDPQTKFNEYYALQRTIDTFKSTVARELSKLKEIHPEIDPQIILKPLEGAISDFKFFREKYPKLAEETFEFMINLLKGKIGRAFSGMKLLSTYEEARKRFDYDIPPGYRDKNKEQNRYGDVVLWHQIKEKAKEINGSPIIFVINDTKRDWFCPFGKKPYFVPRPELLEEISE